MIKKTEKRVGLFNGIAKFTYWGLLICMAVMVLVFCFALSGTVAGNTLALELIGSMAVTNLAQSFVASHAYSLTVTTVVVGALILVFVAIILFLLKQVIIITDNLKHDGYFTASNAQAVRMLGWAIFALVIFDWVTMNDNSFGLLFTAIFMDVLADIINDGKDLKEEQDMTI